MPFFKFPSIFFHFLCNYMNRYISKVLKLESYLEGNLLKRYPTGAHRLIESLIFGPPCSSRGPPRWRLGRAARSFSPLRAHLALSFCAARASKLHFGGARGGSGCLLDGLGWYFSIVFLGFPRWRALQGTTPRSYEHHSFYCVERTWR